MLKINKFLTIFFYLIISSKAEDYSIIDSKNKIIPKIETKINPFKITNENIKNISLEIFSEKKNSLSLKSTKAIEFEKEINFSQNEINNFLENLKIIINFENAEQFENIEIIYKINFVDEKKNFEINQKLEIYNKIPITVENTTLSFQSGLSLDENIKILTIEKKFFENLQKENIDNIKLSFTNKVPIWLKSNFKENELFFEIEIPLDLNNNQNLSFFLENKNLGLKSNLIEFWMIENDIASSNFSKYFIITLYFLITIAMFIVILLIFLNARKKSIQKKDPNDNYTGHLKTNKTPIKKKLTDSILRWNKKMIGFQKKNNDEEIVSDIESQKNDSKKENLTQQDIGNYEKFDDSMEDKKNYTQPHIGVNDDSSLNEGNSEYLNEGKGFENDGEKKV